MNERPFAGGATGDAQFNTAETFPCHCAIHASMKGTIIVT